VANVCVMGFSICYQRSRSREKWSRFYQKIRAWNKPRELNLLSVINHSWNFRYKLTLAISGEEWGILIEDEGEPVRIQKSTDRLKNCFLLYPTSRCRVVENVLMKFIYIFKDIQRVFVSRCFIHKQLNSILKFEARSMSRYLLWKLIAS